MANYAARRDGYNNLHPWRDERLATRFKKLDAPAAPVFFKEWREWRGWTQQELADELGTSKQTVSRIETQARDWGKGYLEAFAYVIGCRAGDPISAPPVTASPAQFDELLETISRLSPARLEQLLAESRKTAPSRGPKSASVDRASLPAKEK